MVLLKRLRTSGVRLQREALSLCSRLVGLLALTEARVKLEVLRYRWAFKRRGA